MQLNTRGNGFLEPRRTRTDRVNAGGQGRGIVEAVVIRGNCARDVGLLFGDGDFRFRHRSALRVSHRASDVSGGARLGMYADKQTNAQQEYRRLHPRPYRRHREPPQCYLK